MIIVAFVVSLAGCAGDGRVKLDPTLRRDVKNIGGYQYVPLARVCDVYGLQCDWDGFTRKATIRKGSHYVVALADSDQVLVDGVEKRLVRPVIMNAAAIYIPVTLAGSDLVILAAAGPDMSPEATSTGITEPPKKISINTVVLDPGHGGRDIGAIGRYHRLQEKDYALSVARKIKKILEEEGLRVSMTRDSDYFMSLTDRTDMANKTGADLFVSIHINASRAKFLRGFECYYLSDATDDNARALEALENSSLKLNGDALAEHSSSLDKTLWDMTLTENRIESAKLAGDIVQSVKTNAPINTRGVKTARFYVLKHTSMPSILVEVCYLSNRVDETKLMNSRFEDKIAGSVAGGILKYKSDFEKTEGFTKI